MSGPVRLVLAAGMTVAACGAVFVSPAAADAIIEYNEYGASPTIGRGHGTSVDPRNPGYGAMRIFIQKVMDYTDDQGPDALPAGQKVVFQRNQGIGREVNALTAGVQFANAGAAPRPAISAPSWGFIYNSMPFGMNFQQMLGFLYDTKVDGRNGIDLAQSILDSRGGTQIAFPVVGSTMQGSGYFPQPIGKPACSAGDADCASQGDGIGLAGLCTSGWRIRYLSPPQAVVDRACDILVKTGVIPAKTLTFYPAVGGQSVLLPMQKRTIQGFEFVTPFDDLVDFFPMKDVAATRPLGNPDAGTLDCGPAVPFPIPAGTQSNCSQNIGQIGARYAHHPAWHQPFLLSWMHVDKTTWNSLGTAQKAAVLRAAKDAVVETYRAAESIQCSKLKAILDVNDGVHQRNVDGSIKLAAGNPVSADITTAAWPAEALKVLLEARDEYLAALEGPSEKTDAQKDFSAVLKAVTQYAAAVGAQRFDPGEFPAKTGLSDGEDCKLARG